MKCSKCDREATRMDQCDEHQPKSSNRRWALTDKGKRAIGVPVVVDVPLLDVPWHPDLMKVVD